MKPDHEINGRYFVEVEIQDTADCGRFLFYVKGKIIAELNFLGQPGFYWLELEKFYGVGNNSVAYEIKLHEGKAVVLGELPIEEIHQAITHEEKHIMNKAHEMISNQQSPDELAEKLAKDYTEKHFGKRKVDRYIHDAFIAGYKANRVKSELTELPKEVICDTCGDTGRGKPTLAEPDGEEYGCKCAELMKSKQQSDDELAEETLKKYDKVFYETGYNCTDTAIEYCDVKKAMQEYHRFKSERLFTKEQVISLMNGFLEYSLGEDVPVLSAKQWLESKNK